MTAATYLSKSAFAAHIGRSPSYITWLKENGRLVLSPMASRSTFWPPKH
jgi:hydroxymethylglutaryl-CoA reductase